MVQRQTNMATSLSKRAASSFHSVAEIKSILLSMPRRKIPVHLIHTFTSKFGAEIQKRERNQDHWGSEMEQREQYGI